MTKNKKNNWPLAVAAGAFTTALIGGVAFAGFQPLASSDGMTVGGPTADLAQKALPKNRLKAVLDALVTKNTISQTQEDAILQAVKDAQPRPKPARPSVPHVRSFVGDLTKTASDYLGMDRKTLLTQLRGGKSVADIANGLSAQGKSAAGLIALLTTTANGKVDAAVTANMLTPDQATSLKAKIASEITTFVNKSFTVPTLPRPTAPLKPTPSPKS